MSNWIALNANDLHLKHETVNIGGADVGIELSPFDIPEAVRRKDDPDKGESVIEFKYMGEPRPTEPLSVISEEGGVVIKVGGRSKRIYQVAITGKNINMPGYMANVRQAIRKALTHKMQWRVSSNYKLAEGILEAKAEQLQPEFNPARAAG